MPVLAMILLAWTPALGSAQERELSRFEGEYTFSGGEDEEARLNAAIDQVVAHMDPLTRSMARSRIRENVQVEQRVAIEVEGEGVRLTLDDWRSRPIPIGGEGVREQGPDGNSATLTARLDGERLAITQRTDRGTRENWFTIAEGGYLFMQVRISSDQLPESIRYTLSYRSTDAPAVARRD